MKKFLLVFLMVVTSSVFGAPARAGGIVSLHLDTAIQPISSEYIVNGIHRANREGATIILLYIDTPGGYVTSVEKIQKAILASKAPIVAYVAPPGARAASGGAYVAITCDVIAMAPGTNIGAAHPVGALPFSLPEKAPSKGKNGHIQQKAKEQGSIEMEKIVNDLAAKMRSIAQNRGRNVEAAEKMVRQSTSLSEREALKAGLIDLIASHERDIFKWINSHPIKRFDGSMERLTIASNPTITPINMTVRESFLSGLANPSLAFILLILGALGLFVEFKSPGLIFPGVLGAIFILLYVMSIPILPVNVVGLLLIILGIIFFILEVKVVSYGMLTVGGVISLIFGGMMLYNKAPIPELRLSLAVVLPVVLAFSGIIVFLLILAAKSMRNPVQTGREGIIGQEGVVRDAIEPPNIGKVFVFGEYWNARSDRSLPVGERIKVTEQQGMTLTVAPILKGGNNGVA